LLHKQTPEVGAQDPVYLQALERAVKIKGSAENLAAHMGVPIGELRIWQQGLAPVPAAAFLKIVDVLYSDPPG
jgi:hypothetical protein